MTTTIALGEYTLDMLKHMKNETDSVTYDETIRKLILKAKKPKESIFGIAKGLKPFKREEYDRFETKWKKKYP